MEVLAKKCVGESSPRRFCGTIQPSRPEAGDQGQKMHLATQGAGLIGANGKLTCRGKRAYFDARCRLA
jgi:hypothetical protein